MTEHPQRNTAVRWVALGFLVFGALLVSRIVTADRSREPKPRFIEGYVPWSKETLRVAETIPVQDGGRIKPLSTFAGFELYQIHGDRSMKIEVPAAADENGANKSTRTIELKPTAWLLDCLFRPQYAADLPMFRVDNSAVIKGLGLEAGAMRDRYSYRDIQPGRAKLAELEKEYAAKDSEARTPEQQQTLDLAANVKKLEDLFGYLAFARGVTLDHAEPGQPQNASMSTILASADLFSQVVQDAQAKGQEIPAHVRSLVEQIYDFANLSRTTLLLYPPDKPDARAWTSMGDEIWPVMMRQAADPARSIKRVKLLEDLVRAADQSDAEFFTKLNEFRDETVALAQARGEYRTVMLEASYYRADWFLNALVFFLLGSVLAGGMWMAGWNRTGKVLAWLCGLSAAAGFVYCAIAIGERCYIMGRPPVGNLYDTVIFIAATIVLFSFVIELLTRRRFALGLAPVMGAALILLSRKYEIGDAKDHMDPLVAVLRSNYWLTIHVITITLGYMAGLLTAFISHLYLFMRGTGLDAGDRSLRRTLTRAAYGCVCFTLFLSLVGTVLGGVWANDSWGRFWGWDPKENGALLIVLWNLAILHARLGGYLKEWSFHLACVFGSCVVVFSWWHVNFFNTGLHSYGFTSGKGLIWIWYGLELLFILLGAVAWHIQNVLEEERKAIALAVAKGGSAPQ